MVKRILFVSGTNFIKDTHSGGKKCSKRNYDVLKSIYGENNIDVVIFDKKIDEKLVDNIFFIKGTNSKIGTFLNCFIGYTRGYSFFSERKLLRIIAKNNYKYIFLDFSGYGKSICRIKKHSKAKVIVFFHNIEKLYEKKRAEKESKLYIISSIAIGRAEKKATKYADYIITLNERDRKLLNKEYGRTSDINLPISFVDCFEEEKIIKTDGSILFVGADFGPNIDGIRWFIKEVMPHIDKKLKIVGKGMEKYREELNSKNVDVIGTVDDLSTFYYCSDAVVLPIRYGDGMKVKTSEALMYGKTVFGTNEAFEGYDIVDKEQGYICNTAEDFINALNSDFVKGYNKKSRQLYREKYDIKSSEKALRQLLC